MWWKVVLLVLVLMLLFFIGGLYAGGALFLWLTDAYPGDVGLTTLFVASKMPLSDPRLLYVPWSWCVTAALTFLPVGVTLLAFMGRFSTKQSLHGDARFANERELRLFEYRGEYQ
ncbi:hypothetical protein ABL975_30555 [Pseudomonas aeruginosa]|uniref:hypothetical protein n=1 Tax=Pseudomonas aeruginosa TaxID=287 RepID=UPI0005A9EB6C|nr:hypothetical protein [Pseudomonas aeruginosa]RPP69991.1 hypothetical protein IPC1152_32055 [Pseudomonas aeruginosa]WBM68674.1 hypothetical protein N9J48_00270 [Pseudomonas aeruginosa]HCD9752118.1 hypothetical protein [Pseudomonas aeruginosa]HCE3964621.1 hypothetical protein [Pseudomonas aeruginosa]HCE4265391.1 hypothetical protein [Pseudomonas aeruginosa]